MKKLLSPFVLALATAAPAAIIQFDLRGTGGTGLLFSNEPGVLSGGTGGEVLGGITFDNVTKLLTINVAWGSANGFSDLTGNTSNAHIHGPTANANGNIGGTDFVEANLGVLINLQASAVAGITTNPSATGGGISGTTTVGITAAQEAALLGNRTYLNVHTTANGGGEMRGFLVQVPEPSTALVTLTALGACGLRRRRA